MGGRQRNTYGDCARHTRAISVYVKDSLMLITKFIMILKDSWQNSPTESVDILNLEIFAAFLSNSQQFNCKSENEKCAKNRCIDHPS